VEQCRFVGKDFEDRPFGDTGSLGHLCRCDGSPVFEDEWDDRFHNRPPTQFGGKWLGALSGWHPVSLQ
jgi:hypothetical protein